LPWFVLVACAIPEQPAFFFIHEHWDRFFLKEHHREGPWYYFPCAAARRHAGSRSCRSACGGAPQAARPFAGDAAT
jgi:hypothetical protein